MKKKEKLRRVDYQVTLITAIILIVSFLCTYLFTYSSTHDDMIYSLKERSNSIYEYIDGYVDKTSFTQENVISMDDDNYNKMKKRLEECKEVTNVRYLYTATIDSKGNYIYLVDGLPLDSYDFRKPGDLIEKEIIPEMQKAMENHVVMPGEIKSTEWGKIFVCYFPIHDNGKVVGVLGIEFDAAHQYAAFQNVKMITVVVMSIACVSAAFLAIRMFRRISNPLFQDLKNTDYLTNLKSRNAFEIDVKNHEDDCEQISIVVADMNDLKVINDKEGHHVGDQYIVLAAKIMQQAFSKYPVYRFGGDEFVVLCKNNAIEDLHAMVDSVKKYQGIMNESSNTHIVLSIGFATFDKSLDASLKDTFKRADNAMYENKKMIKKQQSV